MERERLSVLFDSDIMREIERIGEIDRRSKSNVVEVLVAEALAARRQVAEVSQ
ncbi:MAG TPA: hypothetical protein VM031_04015 [Phycisphaerae bacterium]|nr:hypothetical protein [Phycisphaerae bacterium]